MGADNSADYVITADPSGFEGGMAKAVAAAKNGSAQIQSSMQEFGSAFKGVMGQIFAFAAVLKGGEFLKDGIAETVKLTSETMSLSKMLGVSSTAASTLNVALKSIGSDADVYTSSLGKLTKQVRTNEDSVKAMGVATRDSNGQYLNGQQLMDNAISALLKYKEGTDRNLAAQTLFGKGAAEVTALLKLNSKVMEEATKKADELGLVIGPEQAEKTKQYKQALRDVDEVLHALENAVGQAVMPIFTELAHWFSSVGPTAVSIFRSVFGELGNLFQIVIDIANELWADLKEVFDSLVGIINDAVGGDISKDFEFWKSLMIVVQVAALGLKNGIVIAFEVIRGAIMVAVEYLKAWAAVAIAAFHLDWDGVKSAWSDGTQAIEKVISDSQDRIVEKSRRTGEQIQDALMGGAGKSPDKAPDAPQGKSFTAPGEKDGKEVSDKFKAQFAVIKAELEGQLNIQKQYLLQAQEAYDDAYKHNLLTTEEFYAAKLSIEQQNLSSAIRIKEEELRETQALEAKAQKAGKQSDVLALKAQELKITAELTVLTAQYGNAEVKNARETNDALEKKKNMLLEIARLSTQQSGTADVERERIALAEKRALNQINDQQEIEAAIALQNRLFEIDRQALREKALQFDNNKEMKEANNAAIEQLERQHQTKMMQMQSQATIAQNRDLVQATANIRSGFESSIAGMLNGTMTLQKGMQNVWNSILQGFSQFIAKKVAAWALGESAQTSATLAGNAVRTESDWLAAAQSVAANAWSAIKNIAMKAWEVAASVYSALASIPYVGPFIAPVAAVAATGVVLGFASHIASASGGYDIPAGVNPMTQLHQKEMVLPAKHADTIRALGENGGAGGGGDIHLHVNAVDAASVKRLFNDHAPALADALKKQVNRFGV